MKEIYLKKFVCSKKILGLCGNRNKCDKIPKNIEVKFRFITSSEKHETGTYILIECTDYLEKGE